VWRLNRDDARAVIDGLCRARKTSPPTPSSSSSLQIVVSNDAWRDELVRLLLHAGYSPSFAQQPSSSSSSSLSRWIVTFDDAASISMQFGDGRRQQCDLLRAQTLGGGRTWCVDMRSDATANDGFVVVRRIRRGLRRERTRWRVVRCRKIEIDLCFSRFVYF
jgi:hypothetical protein